MAESAPASSRPEGAEVLAALERIEARLDRLERSLAPATAPWEHAPDALATVADTFDDACRRLGERGVNVDERLRAALAALERLTSPPVLESLQRALDVAQAIPGAVGAAADSFDYWTAELARRGINVDERLQIVARVADRLTSEAALSALCKVLDRVDAIHHVLDAGVFDEGAVAVIGMAAEALAKMDRSAPKPIGGFGALRALSDPGIQSALGAAVEFGRRFGEAVANHDPNTPLRRSEQ